MLVASDLAPRYLDCWPLARRAWREICGLEAVLVLVAPACDIPPELARDPAVRSVEPIPGLHTAFQAQCIRLLAPALVETDEGVLIADVDIVPLSARWFLEPASRVSRRQFLSYRDVLLAAGEIPICYNAAAPEVWADVFGVRDADDLSARLRRWGEQTAYAGTRGGDGWTTDQVLLHDTLVARARERRDVWLLDDRLSGVNRLVGSLVGPAGPDAGLAGRIARGVYTDFHLVHPYASRRELNDAVVDAARSS